MKEQALCTHIKTNGTYCQAVALQDKEFCYFHSRDRQRRKRLSRNLKELAHNVASCRLIRQPRNEELELIYADDCAKAMDELELPPLEDANAIQVNLTAIVRALATQQIYPRSAGLILYALQIASQNLDRLRTATPGSDRIAESDPEPVKLGKQYEIYQGGGVLPDAANSSSSDA